MQLLFLLAVSSMKSFLNDVFHSQIIKFEKHVSNESGVPNRLIAKKIRIWFSKSESYAWLIHLKDVFRTCFFIPSNDRPLDKSVLLSAGISFPYQVFRKSSDTWEVARL